MRLFTITAAAVLALSLSACATSADLRELNKTIKTLQDDKSCDSHKEWDIGGDGGTVGGGHHASFKGSQDCGSTHGSQAIPKPLVGATIPAAPKPST